jgi:hypothetical protein
MSFHISSSLVNRDAVDHFDVNLLSVFRESGPAGKLVVEASSSGDLFDGGFVSLDAWRWGKRNRLPAVGSSGMNNACSLAIRRKLPRCTF